MRWVALVALVPLVAAHGGHGHDEALLEGGEDLMVGGFSGAQPGPLVVVPFLESHLPCDAAAAGYLLRAGPATVAIVSNATHIRVLLRAEGFVAAGLDSSEAVRTLLLMQEHAVTLHAMAAAVVRDADIQVRGGVLGIPYLQPGGDDSHAAHFAGIEKDPVLLDYGQGTVESCQGFDGSMGVDFARNATTAWAPGRLVHAALLVDPEVAEFLPRPLETTALVQYNLYLSRPGEDPAALREAFDPSLGAQDGASLLAVGGVGALALVAAIRRT